MPLEIKMIRETKSFEITCDECGNVVRGMAQSEHDLIRIIGWSLRESHGWGATNYTKTLHVCNKCPQKRDDWKP